MTTEQEALKCADAVEASWHDMVGGPELLEAAAMLRKLVAEREEHRAVMRRALEAALHVTDCATRNEHGEVVLLGSLYDPQHLDAAITDLRRVLGDTT